MAKPSIAISVQPHGWTENEFKRAYRRIVTAAMQKGLLTETERREIGISPTPKTTVTVVAVEELLVRAA